MMPTKFGSLKLGVAFGLFFIIARKRHFILSIKANFGFSLTQMSLLV